MRIAALFAPLLAFTACSSQPDHRSEKSGPETVAAVDLERYQGLWYEIARYPNAFEDKDAYTCVGVTAEYTLREDGKVQVTNSCRKDALDGELDVANGVARVVGGNGAKLKVKFAPAWVPFAEGDYWVLDLTGDYSAALVGDPEGRYLWILSRNPQLPADIRASLLKTASDKGYDTAPLIWPEQAAVEAD